MILFFSGLTASNFYFYLTSDLHRDISSRALLFLLSASLYCVFIFSPTYFLLFSCTFSFFFPFSRRKKEALLLLFPPLLMPPVWLHTLLAS